MNTILPFLNECLSDKISDTNTLIQNLFTILVSRTMIISQACSFVIISQIPDKKLTQHYSQQKQHSNDRVNYFYK